MPLIQRRGEDWPEESFIQISEAQVGRAVRTARWKYGVDAPFKQGLLPAARAVISGLLTGEATKRLTASEVLKREWVGGDGVDDGSDRFPPPQETRPRTARGSSRGAAAAPKPVVHTSKASAYTARSVTSARM